MGQAMNCSACLWCSIAKSGAPAHCLSADPEDAQRLKYLLVFLRVLWIGVSKNCSPEFRGFCGWHIAPGWPSTQKHQRYMSVHIVHIGTEGKDNTKIFQVSLPGRQSYHLGAGCLIQVQSFPASLETKIQASIVPFLPTLSRNGMTGSMMLQSNLLFFLLIRMHVSILPLCGSGLALIK